MDIEVKRRKYKVKPQESLVAIAKPSFWKGKSFDELAKEQDVKPFDFGKCGSNWLKEADFDDYITAIKSGRKHTKDE
ncbi:MAG: hypothetical protein Q8O16_01295 [Dehalococcoidia bacterium]|nr:hypothetical protein [Dehalococcoidia bacterium]